ncbi:hypothetical protein INR49_001642 [Caranx melampygus]|nr:hypothetical protein INR49_001642 [Caranx melampygus]
MCQNDRYTVGGSEMFDTLTDLVDFYKRKGIEEISGNWVHLIQPYYSTRVNAADIDSRVKELNQTAQQKQEGEGEKSKAGFWEEFDNLQKLEAKVKKSREEGQRPENKSKNRYKNILPFNDTRVILQDADPNVVGSDYINANYVKNTLWESQDQKVYIATQGCLATTVNDFWQMVWQENTSVIVMTTREVEKGRNKCVPYWPDLHATKEMGNYMVTCELEREATDYKVRVLEIALQAKPKQSRQVWHYQYLSWPDHGVPQEPGGVLSFLTQVNSKQAEFPNAGPMIIHCSAGIGRTGTILVIDMILETIDTQGLDCDIDIPKYIQMVREQRSGMVQTEAQYKFIYLAVSEYIQTTKAKDCASMEAETEYGNLQLKHQPASRKVSKSKEDVYENLSKGKKDAKKSKSEKKSGSCTISPPTTITSTCCIECEAPPLPALIPLSQARNMSKPNYSGTYHLAEQDNMDSYLAALDINFALRKIVCLLKPTKEITHDPATGAMKIRTITTLKNFNMDFTIGKEFTEDLGPVDGRTCQTTVSWEGDKLLCVQRGEKEGRGWTHWLEGDKLHLEMRVQGIVAKQVFKKED